MTGGPVDRSAEHLWLDADAGPVVRPYTVTAGRTRPATGDFDAVSLVVATGTATDPAPPPFSPVPEQAATLAFLSGPTTVAEIAAHLALPLGVVRVLLGDLLQYGLIAPYEPPGADPFRVLQALRDGLESL